MKLKALGWVQLTRTWWLLQCEFELPKGRGGTITIAEVRRVTTRVRVNKNGTRPVVTHYVELLGSPSWFADGFDGLEDAMTAAVREARKVITQLASRLKP